MRDCANCFHRKPVLKEDGTWTADCEKWDCEFLSRENMIEKTEAKGGDLISRQDAIDALEEQLDYLQMLNKNENPTAEGKWYGVNWARNTIADLPYKQNERPKGEWIEKVYTTKVGYGYLTSHDIVCSVCGEDNDDIEGTPQMTKFCPNCGADMRGGAE